MTQTVLVFNAGSSSLKFTLLDSASSMVLVEGIAERLETEQAVLHFKEANLKTTTALAESSHKAALAAILVSLSAYPAPVVIGHRVVHGGKRFSQATLINADVLKAIEDCIPLAPLHNPANLEGINAALSSYPAVPQVAVFDTAFHAKMPEYAYLYALPRHFERDYNIRKYGFHGTSHHYISRETARLTGNAISAQNLVIAHLGNGASVSAVSNGRSVDTSMGMTPSDGLVMGTRSGSLDPGILIHLMQEHGYSAEQLDILINKRSGLLGLSELTADMRELEEALTAGSAPATVAIEVFCYRLAQTIASMAIALPSLDVLVFTGGIGENSPLVRALTCRWLGLLNIKIDSDHNEGAARNEAAQIDAANSAVSVWVIPTNEELMIANEALALLANVGESQP
ncbi:acetate/propionate family kinase [Umboniibacter marinipuniceus]|uniref:Acetate kinase n=1 Tax=Umboniibacter marinipuniceus TaxID=569599 RepID=A0A3M0A819_9GAMM|nr:acetate kinase [Umboniibacter marinipuniceus]RMA81223.1 acetate kinase [Umboniibacter marinipuniceus]